ncbi:methyltransferase family protein [Desulfospira joergensenii]|uniref:methyltransferase family protein n=1 Tax=Desulfospira joergensenii TaxID=53329 RepID=UPI0003B51B38|nr:isoprenylcysteine carboxylmethyltransferase family protein [Desulfospira joergensenii]
MKKKDSAREKIKAGSIMILAPFLGMISLLLFTLFLFSGRFHPMDLKLPEQGLLIWDTLLSLIFFVQHSAMIRRGFQSRLIRSVPPHYVHSIFTIASSLVLILAVLLWQPSTIVLFELQGLAKGLARGIFLLGIAGTLWGGFSLKGFDPFGRIPLRDYLKGRPGRTWPFSVTGPYRWVRHPLYFFVLVMIWACPVLTADRLLFNILWTLWIILGAHWEEKDLVSDFGKKYSRYQEEVPMLIPWKIPGKKSGQ